MKKALPEAAITNELKGRSAFFSPRLSSAISDSQPKTELVADVERTPERVNRRTHEQANARTGEHPKTASGKRIIKRQSYNVYQDQHEALQRLEATGVLAGKGVFISEMVREALDDYLQNRSDSVRTPERVNT